MTLDVLALSSQVRGMSSMLRNDAERFRDRLSEARALLSQQADDWDYWTDEVAKASSTSPFLLAQPLEAMNAVYDAPPCPTSYAVAASDGSHLELEHYGRASCYVINIGTATIAYGGAPGFQAATEPTLWYEPHDLVVEDEKANRDYVVTGPVLAAKRDLWEGMALANVSLTLSDELPRLALQDGTLIRWSLQEFDPFLRNRFLGDYLSYLGRMQELQCPVASYMSQPRSPEVMGLVRFLHVQGNLDRWKQQYPRRADNPFYGLVDHLVFEDMLRDGQRSARFASCSRILEHYLDQKIQFFYLKVGREIARVEFPAWVAEEGYLDLAHALVYDQTRRGVGYPAVLQRAHEQAVIHDDDRRHLQALVERLLVQSDVPLSNSAKTASKLRPRV